MNLGGTLRINKFACFTLIFILFVIIYWRSGSAEYPTDKSDFINLKSLLNAAIKAAERGGKNVVTAKNHDLNIESKGKTKEGMNDPVTKADYASHCAMFYGIKETFPKLTVISEEQSKGDVDCENREAFDVDSVPEGHSAIEYLNDELVFVKDVTVWIDPLDATQEYTEGLYDYVTTMVCIAVRGNPLIGVIHYPFSLNTYWGWYMKRVSSNVLVPEHKEDHRNHPSIVVSRSHAGKVKDIAGLAFGPDTVVTAAGGAGYKVMGVVNGTFDVYLHATAIKKWDICAGNAIIKAVDGKLTTAKGETIDYSHDSNTKVEDGILVARFDHDYYLKRLKEMAHKT